MALTFALAGCGGGTDVPTTPVVPVVPVTPAVQEAATPKLPVLRITTAGGAPVVSRDVYLTGSITLTDTAGTVVAQGPTEIKGRGNTTWTMPKKPYRLKLGTSTALLGMPASKHWVLLANYSDKTLLRNDLTFELSRRVGMAWTPRSRFVELEVNGSYDGVYQLVEHVRVAPDRVNITEVGLADTTAAKVTGGYLLEVDERRGEAFCFNSSMTRMVWCVNTPETLLDAGWTKQHDYIVNYIARTDSAIFGATFTDSLRGYAAYIDVESAVNYYLVQEIVKNVDGDLRFSGFMFKPRGGKLTFGPLWDFDLAIGNANYYGADATVGWYSRHAEWYSRLFQDPAFRARVQARFAELRRNGTLDELVRLTLSRANYLSIVQDRNFRRWPILDIWVWPNRVVTGSYSGEAAVMHEWLTERIAWMNLMIDQ